MKNILKLAVLFILFSLSTCEPAYAQSATAFRFRAAAADPANCIFGTTVIDVYINSTTGPKWCSAANTWSLFGGSTFTTQILGPDGTAGAPTFSFSGETNTGVYHSASNVIDLSITGTRKYAFFQSDFYMLDDSARIRMGASSDVNILRDAANTLALRNSTNPQRLNIGNTYTSGSNREDLSFYFNINVAHIATTTTGATARVLQIDYGGTTTSAISIPITSGSITVGSNVVIPAAAGFLFTSQGGFLSNGDGIFNLSNAAFNNFNRLQFGGTTNLFPALKRSTTSLQVRLADDSADGNLTTGNLTVNGTCTGCGGTTSTNGQSVLAADVAFSSTSFTDVTGLSVTLPSSGTYLITAVVNYSASCTSGCATTGPDLYFQLFNSTDTAGVASSQVRAIGAVASTFYVNAVTLNNIVTVAASKIIIVQAKRSTGTYAASNVTGTTADGISRISYIKLN